MLTVMVKWDHAVLIRQHAAKFSHTFHRKKNPILSKLLYCLISIKRQLPILSHCGLSIYLIAVGGNQSTQRKPLLNIGSGTYPHWWKSGKCLIQSNTYWSGTQDQWIYRPVLYKLSHHSIKMTTLIYSILFLPYLEVLF